MIRKGKCQCDEFRQFSHYKAKSPASAVAPQTLDDYDCDYDYEYEREITSGALGHSARKSPCAPCFCNKVALLPFHSHASFRCAHALWGSLSCALA